MSFWKIPPKAKIYEALSAIGDKRVTISGPESAEVISSSGTKKYTVEWMDDMQKITSNDNASYWQGYTGYPIIAVLLQKGKLPYSKETARQLSGIHWSELNKKFRRDYEKAIAFAMEEIQARGGNPDTIRNEVDRIYQQLKELNLQRLPRRKAPPK